MTLRFLPLTEKVLENTNELFLVDIMPMLKQLKILLNWGGGIETKKPTGIKHGDGAKKNKVDVSDNKGRGRSTSKSGVRHPQGVEKETIPSI